MGRDLTTWLKLEKFSPCGTSSGADVGRQLALDRLDRQGFEYLVADFQSVTGHENPFHLTPTSPYF